MRENSRFSKFPVFSSMRLLTTVLLLRIFVANFFCTDSATVLASNLDMAAQSSCILQQILIRLLYGVPGCNAGFVSSRRGYTWYCGYQLGRHHLIGLLQPALQQAGAAPPRQGNSRQILPQVKRTLPTKQTTHLHRPLAQATQHRANHPIQPFKYSRYSEFQKIDSRVHYRVWDTQCKDSQA